MQALTPAELRVGEATVRVGELTVGERLALGMVEDPLLPQSSGRTDPVSSFPCSHPTAPPASLCSEGPVFRRAHLLP